MYKKNQVLTLLQFFDEENRHFSLRVGKDRSAHTYINKVCARNHVEIFLKEEYHLADIPLCELQLDFIQRFSVFLSSSLGLKGGTIWLNCMQLKSVILKAYQRGLIASNPFAEFRIVKNIRERRYLTEEEIKRVAKHTFSNPMYTYIRDIFLFSAFTGISFADIQDLKQSNIREMDGHYWIVMTRHKTGVPFRVRLMGPALKVLSCYMTTGEKQVFDQYDYYTIAKNLPVVMRECGIQKHITFHCARHTFAVMALNQGMPIESISSILGHSNITTTQIYAKITMKKLNSDFVKLEKELSPIFESDNRKGLFNKLLFYLSSLRKVRIF